MVFAIKAEVRDPLAKAVKASSRAVLSLMPKQLQGSVASRARRRA